MLKTNLKKEFKIEDYIENLSPSFCFWLGFGLGLGLKLRFVNFHENPSCLKASRTLLKNDDTQLEFGRMWMFLTGAGILDHILDVFF